MPLGLSLLVLLAAAPAPAPQTFAGFLYGHGKKTALTLTLNPGDKPMGTYQLGKAPAVVFEGQRFEDGLRVWDPKDPSADPGNFIGDYDASHSRLTGFWFQGKDALGFDLATADALPRPGPGAGAATVADRKLAKEDPKYRWPEVTLPDAAAAQRINDALAVGQVLHDGQLTFDKVQGGYVKGLAYEVGYNDRGLLDLTLRATLEGIDVHTDTHHRLFNLQTGAPLQAGDAFKPEQLGALLSLLTKRLDAVAKHALEKLTPVQREGVLECIGPGQALGTDLNHVRVSKDGAVSLQHEWGCPQAARGLEPDGVVTLTPAELKAYVRPDGPLAVLLKK